MFTNRNNIRSILYLHAVAHVHVAVALSATRRHRHECRDSRYGRRCMLRAARKELDGPAAAATHVRAAPAMVPGVSPPGVSVPAAHVSAAPRPPSYAAHVSATSRTTASVTPAAPTRAAAPSSLRMAHQSLKMDAPERPAQSSTGSSSRPVPAPAHGEAAPSSTGRRPSSASKTVAFAPSLHFETPGAKPLPAPTKATDEQQLDRRKAAEGLLTMLPDGCFAVAGAGASRIPASAAGNHA